MAHLSWIRNTTTQNNAEKNRTLHYNALHCILTCPRPSHNSVASVGALASATPRITSHGTTGHDKAIQYNSEQCTVTCYWVYNTFPFTISVGALIPMSQHSTCQKRIMHYSANSDTAKQEKIEHYRTMHPHMSWMASSPVSVGAVSADAQQHRTYQNRS